MAEGWHVEGQRQVNQLTGAGTFQEAMEIRYVTDSGVHGIITVPVSHYTVEYVRDQIDSRVAKHNDIAAL